jgi:hypothetical protein
MGAKLVPCRNDAECEQLGAFLADRIYEFNAKATDTTMGCGSLAESGMMRATSSQVSTGIHGEVVCVKTPLVPRTARAKRSFKSRRALQPSADLRGPEPCTNRISRALIGDFQP